jgi:hypothetical protein
MIRLSRKVSILSVMVMNTVTVMATVAVAFATPSEGGSGQENGQGNGLEKVTLCHNGHTITIGAPGAAAHLAQHDGDTEGPCADEGTTPEPPDGTTPELTTVATASVTLGEPISDTATLSGGDNPTGTITFNVYGPDDEDCSGESAFTSVVDVNGNGDYSSDPTPSDPSDDFVPSAAGTYRWTADYSGDDNNEAVSSECNAANEQSVVNGTTSTIAMEQNITLALHHKRQELRETKAKLQADETPREDKGALRERREQLREEVNRLKSEPGDTGE